MIESEKNVNLLTEEPNGEVSIDHMDIWALSSY